MIRTRPGSIFLMMLLPLASACSSDDSDDSCLPDGTATVSGTVMGRTYSGPLHAQQILTGDGGPGAKRPGFIFWDGTCSSLGQSPSILVELCATPQVGSYPLQDGLNCPGQNSIVILQDQSGGNEIQSTAGTLEVERVTKQCVRGSYSASFGAETQTAMFDAVICP